MIELKVEGGVLEATLQRIGALDGGAPALMLQARGILRDAVEANFAAQGRPKWAALKPASLASKYQTQRTTKKGNPRRNAGERFAKAVAQNKILQSSGRLASSIQAQSDANSAVVGTNLVYAAIHQFGGKTGPHQIRPLNKKALAFGGIVRKVVNHPGSKIPARPFLQLTSSDLTKLERAADNYLRGLLAA